MDETLARRLICQTGRELLETGLVARTWGNVSCRLDANRFAISPSGLDYLKTEPEDIALVDIESLAWEGKRKPSQEKGVHAAAYALLDDCGFVIHTHQSCASAIGLAGFEELEITETEQEALGGVAKASYGLPGTKKLRNAVSYALEGGAHTVLMSNHGAVFCGETKQQAMDRALLLEDICRRSLAMKGKESKRLGDTEAAALLEAVRLEIPDADMERGEYSLRWAQRRRTLHAQLDDMAQMLGARVDSVPPSADNIVKRLERRDAVFVRGVGAFVRAEEPDDREALKILCEKSALCALHTSSLRARARLSPVDCALMRLVYKKKYSKRKG